VLHRPSSGSFVSYAREFFGEKAAFVAGWMYFLNWSMTGIVDSTAIAQYFHYWGGPRHAPQWLIALIALALVLSVNMMSVKWFGEMEFWAALIKVTALIAFLIVGIVIVLGRFHVGTHTAGVTVVSHAGGWFPTGVLPLVMVTTGVVFAYAAVELVGTAAGETENPEKIMPRAINSVIARIAVFYVGSLVLLAVLLPYTAYQAGTSPFVTFFGKIGLAHAGDLMNVVVLTAAFSSLNAGMYSTGRILRSMSMNGSAPKFTGVMSRRGVPFGGILLTSCIGLLGVVLNAVTPGRAFDIVLDMASFGIIASWGTIVICQLQMWRWWKQGRLERPSYRLFGTPWTGLATLVFLIAIPVLMVAHGTADERWEVAILVFVICPMLVVGWFACRKRVLEIADQRSGYTGEFPVVANIPVEPDATA
jgi:L-asparagine permease